MNAATAKVLSPAGPPALEFPFPTPPDLGETIEIRPGCLWLRMPLPFALNHINLWMLRDGDGWTIVDTGLNLSETQAAWDKIFDQLGARIKRIIVTHCHPDHFGLAGWLTRRFDVTMWMTQGEFFVGHALFEGTAGTATSQTLDLFTEHGLDATRMQDLNQRGNTYRLGVFDPPTRYRRIQAGEVIPIGEHQWKVIFGYGHSPEHAALFCESQGLLISGDMLLPKISTNVSVWPQEPESDPVGWFLQSIDAFKPLPVDTLTLPSHGLPFLGMHTRIDALHRHHGERLQEAMQMCENWTTANDLLAVMFRRPLDMHQTYFALGEAIAHLNYLWHRGKLQREKGADAIYRFRIHH